MTDSEQVNRLEVPLSLFSVGLVDEAKTHATHFYHKYIGSEHLLLALFSDPQCAGVLKGLGVSAENVAIVINRIIGIGDYPSDKEIVLAPHARRLISRAEQSAIESGRREIEPRDILLASSISGPSSDILSVFGVTQEKMLSAINQQ